jgi:hypothetical protein
LQHFDIDAVLPFSGHYLCPHTTYNREVASVSPDMAEFLEVATMFESSLGFVHLYPNFNMSKVHQFEYLMEL